MPRWWRRTVIAVASLCTGCGAGWRQVAVTPTALESEPSEVRVTLEDGRRVVVAVPKIERDSLVGEISGKRAAMPMSDVQRIALPEASDSRKSAGTATVAAALAVLIGAWVVLIVSSQ